jgi:hypothetical protein
MQQFTAVQLNEIGNEFLSIAQKIGDYRYNNFSTLDDDDSKTLSDLHQKILGYADDLAFASATIAVGDASGSLAQINSITAQINSTVNKLTEVQKVINVAGAVVTLCASIVSLSPGAIITGISGAVSAVGAL